MGVELKFQPFTAGKTGGTVFRFLIRQVLSISLWSTSERGEYTSSLVTNSIVFSPSFFSLTAVIARVFVSFFNSVRMFDFSRSLGGQYVSRCVQLLNPPPKGRVLT